MKNYCVAVVGATGAVGHELIAGLEERNFPVGELKLLASARSHGKMLPFKGKEVMVEETTKDSFEGVDIVLLAGGSENQDIAHDAVRAGAIVIDNSSAFRMNPEVPLVVPEVNPEDVDWHKGIIANPNCSTIQMVVALKPIHDKARIKKVIVATYQAVSGAGIDGLEELRSQSESMSKNYDPESVTPKVFQYPIAYNLIPHIDLFTENGYTKEEMKMVNETKKMFHDDSIVISPTAVRVPVNRSHSEAISVETEIPLTPAEVTEILSNAKGVVVIDNPENKEYPMPMYTSGKSEVYIGRIRKDLAFENGISLWCVADQLKKGAAINAIQIAELLIERNLLK